MGAFVDLDNPVSGLQRLPDEHCQCFPDTVKLPTSPHRAICTISHNTTPILSSYIWFPVLFKVSRAPKVVSHLIPAIPIVPRTPLSKCNPSVAFHPPETAWPHGAYSQTGNVAGLTTATPSFESFVSSYARVLLQLFCIPIELCQSFARLFIRCNHISWSGHLLLNHYTFNLSIPCLQLPVRVHFTSNHKYEAQFHYHLGVRLPRCSRRCRHAHQTRSSRREG